jgi:hypothetical protein
VSDRLFLSTRKGLFVAERTDGWQPKLAGFLGENVTLTFPDHRDGTWYAALNLGHFGVKLKASKDAGKTWEDRAVPAYPDGAMVITGDGKPPFQATLKMIWSLEAGSGKRLFTGTLPGGLFQSDDGGATWELVQGLWDAPERGNWFGGGYDTPGIHSILVDPRTLETIRVGISCGGVWRSDDGGKTWRVSADGMFADFMPPERKYDQTIQDPHRVVQCPGAPDHLWTQHHNGVFRSTDGGVKWEHVPNAAPSGFGFAVAVHPSDPNTAWFVPAVKDECRVPVDGKLVVSRTRDGGKTFEQLSHGLPSAESYDLVYRHALDVDATGKRLAFGSTTGGLWMSDNGGDSWTSVTTHLPPIHAVRFE